MWPFPVAAKLPYKVTSKRAAEGFFFKNISAARIGPIV